MLSKFTILGERCSGTNLLEKVISEHFSCTVTWEYGWKHWFLYDSKYENSDETLFIGIIRDPVCWLNSLYQSPYHIPKKLLKQHLFLINEFYSTHNDSEEENELDRNPFTKKRFQNVIQMRNCKLNYLINEMPKKVKNYILIRYEDLVYNYSNTIDLINYKFFDKTKNLEKKINLLNYKNEDDTSASYFYPKNVYLHKDINMNLEKSAGYFSFSFPISNEFRILYYTGNISLQEINECEIPKHLNPDQYTLITENTTSTKVVTYLNDTKEIFKFLKNYKVICIFGDVMTNDKYNCFAKCRLLDYPNKKILLKLNYKRHWGDFNKVLDNDINFFEKINKVIWRGTLKTGKRKNILQKFILENKNENIDFKECNPGSNKYRMEIEDQLKHKFLFSIEGNDVATNLKWVLSSNSCVLMALPIKCCTWLMEDVLRPYVHYVPIKDDLSDLEEQYNWCMKNLEICNKIAQNGKKYIQMFLNTENEKNIEKNVIDNYFSNVKLK